MSLSTTARRRWWIRAVAVLVAGGVLSFGGLLPLQDTADAATYGRRCDEVFPAQGIPAADPSQLPWANGDSVRAVADEDTYTYTNQRQAMNGLTLPDDPAEREALLKPLGKHTQYAEGTTDRVYATY